MKQQKNDFDQDTSQNPWQYFLCTESLELKDFLQNKLPQKSKSFIKKAILQNRVRVNGICVTKPKFFLRNNDTVEYNPPLQTLQANSSMPISISLEHKDFLIINKPSTIPCHPINFEETGTLLNALIFHFPEIASAGVEDIEGGLIHRLDNETSGALLVARSIKSFQTLSREFRAHRTTKTYLAIVHGNPQDKGFIDFPIAHHPSDTRKMIALKNKKQKFRGKPLKGVTEFQSVLRLSSQATLVKIRLSGAHRHQIRAHFYAIGHPLVGDKIYFLGPNPQKSMKRHALHASKISFFYAPENQWHSATCPIPPDFLQFDRKLREYFDQ